MTLAVSKWDRFLPMRMGQLRGDKGRASPPRRRWKVTAGTFNKLTKTPRFGGYRIYMSVSYWHDRKEISNGELPDCLRSVASEAQAVP